MKCSQDGEIVKYLTKENGDSITKEDLTKGSSLIMTFRGKHYPEEIRERISCVIISIAISILSQGKMWWLIEEFLSMQKKST